MAMPLRKSPRVAPSQSTISADFRRWVRRRNFREAAGFPDEWTAVERFEQASRIGVVLHVFYPELVPELIDQLESIPAEFDLIVTNATGRSVEIDVSRLENLRNMTILEVANHGRDIWPMVQVVNAGWLDPYDLVLKIHTKKSEWRAGHDRLEGSGADWRNELLTTLLGTTSNVRTILSAFAEDPNLGVISAPGSIVGPEHWGGDLALTRSLMRRIEVKVTPEELRFPSGSMYWIRAFLLQGLRAFVMNSSDFEEESGQIDGTMAHAVERAVGLVATEAGTRIVAAGGVPINDGEAWRRYRRGAPRSARARMVPFYLPQFHTIAENDQWWGKGFTEWANVTAAAPVYRGHNQPNLPSELGFYDLANDAVRQEQMALAETHGIAGFMYYYYWFAGRRLLNMPIDSLRTGGLAKPFCIMWANENWTRRWDGRDEDVLMTQDYDRVPATAFIDDVLPFLRDPRYMRIDGRAVLAVYRIGQIPDYPAVIARWRKVAARAGVGELHVLSVDVATEFDGMVGDVTRNGVDGILGFPPHNHLWKPVAREGLVVSQRFNGAISSYRAMVRRAETTLRRIPRHAYPGVMVTFDNTPRRQWTSHIWYGSNPYTFRRWLSAATSAVADRERSERVVFINAWNEWAEGAVLEPSRRFGRTYLQAVRDVAYG